MTAAGAQPTVDLDGLARLFTTPGLSGEFAPSSFFRGVTLVWPPVAPTTTAMPLSHVFAAAVEELCAAATTVGVALSGGLDSLAALVHVLALRPCRRVVAFVVDLVDDDGERTGDGARRLLADLGLAEQVQVVVIEPADCTASSAWSPHGPRPEAMPAAVATIAERATEVGVDVLLTGDGADELLAVPRYATMQVLRRSGALAAGRYFADMAKSGPGIAGELVSTVSHVLLHRTRVRMYWAANWPDWSPPKASPVLAASRREQALTWAQQWVDASVQAHVDANRSWAAADAFDAWWPRNFRPPAGGVPEASPFLHPDVVVAALALSLGDHYGAANKSPYLRAKALVVDLFPPAMRQVLPKHKRMYRTALGASVAGTCAAPLATKIGLLDGQALAQENDTATLMMVAAVENWLAGAVAAGVTVPS
jgi:asparagine synthase (glutamine-hydrolysing)